MMVGDRLSDGIGIKETAYVSPEWPDGVVLREIAVGRQRRLPAQEYIYCNDIPALKGAFGLPGNAGLVWLLASHRSRVTKTAWVTLPQTMLNEWGIDKSAKSRALAALQAAGYVEVSHTLGRSAQVRLVCKSNP
jgi:hypothetical protein